MSIYFARLSFFNVKYVTRLVLFLAALTLTCAFAPKAVAQPPQKELPLIASLNAYSFSDLLSAKDNRDKQQVYTLFNLLDWCASQKIKALDPTAYFFPTYPEVPTDEYLGQFKRRAAVLGIVISGTGIRNDFASPDPAVRAAGVELAKRWIVAAIQNGRACA